MKKLTLKKVETEKMTFIQCVRFFDESISKKECDFILWSYTCYPFCNKLMIKQLNQYFKTWQKRK